MGKTTPVGGVWTATLIMTYSFALMGIQATPVFTMWAFGSRSPNGFAPQQVWASAAAVGVILIFFSAALGLGALFLGASPAVAGAGLGLANWLPQLQGGLQQDLVAQYIVAIAAHAPWFGALLALCALAAVQAITAAYANAAATMLSRDLYQTYLNPAADDQLQKFYGRLAVGLILLAALLIATYAPAAQSKLGALALGFGFQLWPALAALCWFPWLTRQGIMLGLDRRPRRGHLHRAVRQFACRFLRHRAALGPLAMDHPFRRLGHRRQSRGLRHRLGAVPSGRMSGGTA